ncbi:hypothetical protein EZV62_026540 [Acer yangbiense]|uniref:NAD-dependent epimerase/dehydratase domain-containing protein n=1 Tax=Acer yangbiense TaxID=1000413 RepID=A0A5C7GSZ2_9ROSI|nr:hypothetical protein EZV62_026540 [Acer yangbiense]
MTSESTGKKTACVVGGTGFVASLLIKQLLLKGYAVNTTNDMIKPAIKGVLNVLKACAKAKSVKRVILTSSAAAVSINTLNGTGLVMDEKNWSDVEFLSTEKPPTWGYPLSKTLAEKEAWKFAQENNIDLITVIPCLMTGPALTPEVPSCIGLASSLITGNEFLINAIKGMQILSGSISIAHVEDVCRAHIFVAEKESASGRYICAAVNTSVPELAKFLNKRYPQYEIPTDFGDFPSKAKLTLSSEKLISEGFSFKYGIEEIFDQTVEYLKTKEILK